MGCPEGWTSLEVSGSCLYPMPLTVCRIGLPVLMFIGVYAFLRVTSPQLKLNNRNIYICLSGICLMLVNGLISKRDPKDVHQLVLSGYRPFPFTPIQGASICTMATVRFVWPSEYWSQITVASHSIAFALHLFSLCICLSSVWCEGGVCGSLAGPVVDSDFLPSLYVLVANILLCPFTAWASYAGLADMRWPDEDLP